MGQAVNFSFVMHFNSPLSRNKSQSLNSFYWWACGGRQPTIAIHYLVRPCKKTNCTYLLFSLEIWTIFLESAKRHFKEESGVRWILWPLFSTFKMYESNPEVTVKENAKMALLLFINDSNKVKEKILLHHISI